MNKLSNEVAIALAKGIKKAELDAIKLPAGTHLIDALVHVKGTVTKGEDYEQVVHMSVPQWSVIAVLFSKLNGTTMESVLREALSMPEDQATAIKEQAAACVKTLKASGKEMCAGKTTCKLTFEEVHSMTAVETTATEHVAV